MSRLTQTSNLGGVAFTFDLDVTCTQSEMKKILKIAEKLKEYEDAEEQGLLLKLPCKTGDKVYFVHSGVNCISESEINSVEVKKGVIWAKTITNNYFLNTAIGKTVFLTKEEAENKLKEMGSDK